MELSGFWKVFAVAAVVMGLSHTIAKEKIFYPLRKRLGGMDTWLGYLVSCPYCASHWLSFVLVPLTGVTVLRVAPDWGLASTLLDWFLSSILVTVMAAFLRVGFYFVDESQRVKHIQKQVTEEEAGLREAVRESLGRTDHRPHH